MELSTQIGKLNAYVYEAEIRREQDLNTIRTLQQELNEVRNMYMEREMRLRNDIRVQQCSIQILADFIRKMSANDRPEDLDLSNFVQESAAKTMTITALQVEIKTLQKEKNDCLSRLHGLQESIHRRDEMIEHLRPKPLGRVEAKGKETRDQKRAILPATTNPRKRKRASSPFVNTAVVKKVATPTFGVQGQGQGQPSNDGSPSQTSPAADLVDLAQK